jgi:hypothetical protein
MNVRPAAAEATKPKGSVSAFRRNGSPYSYVRRDIKGVANVTLSTQQPASHAREDSMICCSSFATMFSSTQFAR